MSQVMNKQLENEPKEISILLTGRVPCQSALLQEQQTFGEDKLSFYDCFSPMKAVFDSADLSIGSLSTAYNYPDDFLCALKDIGFDVLSVGVGGNRESKAASIRESLSEHGIEHLKGGKVGTAVIEVKGLRVGIIDCTFNLAFQDMSILSKTLEQVQALGKEKVDLKICYVHWNFFINSMLAFDERQRAIVKALANMGINYIVGAGPLFVMGYETMKGAWNRRVPVAYSLGNLLYCSSGYDRNTSAVILLKVKKYPNGKVALSDSYLPCYTWTILGDKRRRVQFLNDRQYLYDHTNNIASWRKMHAAYRLGDGIPVCHDFDVNKEESANTPQHLEGMPDAFTRERLSDPTELQKVILDSYRLTDEFRETYGKLLYSDAGYSNTVKAAEHYLRCNYPHILEREDAKDIIIDMIYSKTVLEVTFTEYFGFHFMEKSIQDRIDYISDQSRLNYYLRLNIDVNENHVLDNKFRCYERLKDLYKREILNITGKDQNTLFAEFAQKHDRFIIKPTDGSLGKGIQIITRDDYDDADKLFHSIFTRTGPFVCEELVVSRKYLSDFHPQSVNTIRVFTYNNDGDIRYICAYVRFGMGSNIVDNGGAGGLTAAIDTESGIVESDAINEGGKVYDCHPDSGLRFKGTQIQDWDGLKEVLVEASRRFPTVKIIAWDMAHGEKGWQIIEGNSQGQMWVLQNATGRGMRRNMEELIGW